jgi:hypothetical protein
MGGIVYINSSGMVMRRGTGRGARGRGTGRGAGGRIVRGRMREGRIY